jgi:hypothetical protein
MSSMSLRYSSMDLYWLQFVDSKVMSESGL